MRTLVGIDGGAQQRDALRLGVTLANIGEPHELVAARVERAPRRATLGRADIGADPLAWRAQDETLHVRSRSIVVADDHPAGALRRLAVEQSAEVVVVGSSHRGALGRTLLGGLGDRIVHDAPCPVAVAPRGHAGRRHGLRRIGVAFDDSPEARLALRWASRAAASAAAELVVLSVVDAGPYVAPFPSAYPGAGGWTRQAVVDRAKEATWRRLREVLDPLRDELRVRARVLEGPVAASLVDGAEELDLLVAGSRGHGVAGALALGSVSRALTRRAPCPLVLLPRAVVELDAPVAVAAGTVAAS